MYSCPLKRAISNASLYALHGVLAKIIFRSCVKRDGAISIINETFEYFDGTNPVTGKGVSYSILQRFWVMLVSLYTWLNKHSVLVLNISNKERKKLTTLLVQIDRRRSQVEAAQFCWCASPCKNDLVTVSS